MKSDYPFLNAVRGVIGLDPIPGTQVLDFKRTKKSDGAEYQLLTMSAYHEFFVARATRDMASVVKPNAARPRVLRNRP